MVGIDLGERRIGLAVSDASSTLARPLRTIERDRADEIAADTLASAIRALNTEDEISSVVVGLPTRLDGTASDQTARVQKMAALLSSRITMPVVFQDERLSSHEADERLAQHERDWRRRKAKLDAASAAVILQDYLDQQKP
ncbi:MAG TPA: Holliday junction resolvase RuvX [Vicinamibacterales bacterium]|jgi:putative Holliday junction resolvase|nr:Holliday junction resolvase RuvX [Vicinamibacterales bacterium]